MSCRINKKRIWMHRLILEAIDHEVSSFCTLTYTDENLPEKHSLRPADSRNFLKRLRKHMEPSKLRYFLVGEYGDETERPHYHAALFGYPHCQYGQTRYTKLKVNCCENCDTIRRIWGYGNIYLGDLNNESAAYVAGYVTKKLTSANDERLGERHPEFARMSNRPGIGANFVPDIADSLLRNPEVLAREHDVPSSLRHGTRVLPLGRYLRGKLRQQTGVSIDGKAPQETLAKMEEKLLPMRALAYSYAPPGLKAFAFRNEVIASGDASRARVEHLAKLYKQKRHL